MKITTHKIKIPHTPEKVKKLEETHQTTELEATKPVTQSTDPIEPSHNSNLAKDLHIDPPVLAVSTTPPTTTELPLTQPNIVETQSTQGTSIPQETVRPKGDVVMESVQKVEVAPQKTTMQVSNSPQIKSDRKVLVDAKKICKSFYTGKEETKVLKDLSVQIFDEDFLIIVGPSGSGKSTFLHILLGLEIPTSGELNFLGTDLYKNTTEDIRSEFRKQHIGMVYQQPNWIKSMSVLENIAFPLILRGYRQELAHEIAYGALQEVHMEMHANQPATELSGGQQQRVSLARCIVHNPEIIVADEPTGNLDYESGQEVMQLLQSLNVKDKKTVIMVTHDIEYIKFANCAVQIFDGQVAGYYGRNNLSELTTKLHTKHLAQNSLKETYAQKTN